MESLEQHMNRPGSRRRHPLDSQDATVESARAEVELEGVGPEGNHEQDESRPGTNVLEAPSTISTQRRDDRAELSKAFLEEKSSGDRDHRTDRAIAEADAPASLFRPSRGARSIGSSSTSRAYSIATTAGSGGLYRAAAHATSDDTTEEAVTSRLGRAVAGLSDAAKAVFAPKSRKNKKRRHRGGNSPATGDSRARLLDSSGAGSGPAGDGDAAYEGSSSHLQAGGSGLAAGLAKEGGATPPAWGGSQYRAKRDDLHAHEDEDEDMQLEGGQSPTVIGQLDAEDERNLLRGALAKGAESASVKDVDLEAGSVTLSQAAAKAVGLPRTVGVVALAGLAFVTICAGPFGIESAVRSSGPLPVVGAVLVLAIFWGLPQALMCAELSTMIDENGGYVLWVERGMGPFAAWLCAFNSLGSNATDLPLYCILFSSYAGVLIKHAAGMGEDEHLPGWATYVLKCGCLLLMTVLNLRNISSVGAASAVVTCIILAPFILEIGFAWKDQSAGDLGGVVHPIQWGTYTSTLLWNMQGWDSIGTMAGEVKDSARTYPLGIIIALVVITLTYSVPVLVGAGVEPDPSKWTEGALSVIAAQVAPWLGIWVGLGAAAAQLGNGVAMMAASSRVTWQMSKSSMLPPQLGYMWAATAAPAGAVIAHSVTTAALMLLPFSTLVSIDTIFNNVSLLLEGAAFLVLRYTEPDTMRPFQVPGGMAVAWIITISKTAVIIFAIGTASYLEWAACGGANVLFVIAYFILQRCQRSVASSLPVGESRRLLEAKAASNLRRALVDVARGDARVAEAASVGAVLGLEHPVSGHGVEGSLASQEAYGQDRAGAGISADPREHVRGEEVRTPVGALFGPDGVYGALL